MADVEKGVTTASTEPSTATSTGTARASDGESGAVVVYKPLYYTQFDRVIKELASTKIPAGWGPKGKDGYYPTGKDGWIATFFTLRGRAFDHVFWPWVLISLNALWWTVATNIEGGMKPYSDDKLELKSAFSLGLSTCLAFLLTFRLNRSVLRFWEAMKMWCNIVVFTRSLVSSVLVHGRDKPHERDQVVVWTAAICIATKKTLRHEETEIDDLRDLMSDEQIQEINDAPNSALCAVNEVRYQLKSIFDVTKESGPLSPARSGEMRQHEKYLDLIVSNVGGLENILNTPVPLVYVAHLRTFLLIYLLSLPYLVEELWGWSTFPIVTFTAAIFLGIEGASVEVEEPFEKGRVNDLDLDNYCEIIMRDVQQLVKAHNTREAKKFA